MASDILEQAKDALDHAISESSGGVYLDPSCNDLLPICRELIAEVERLRSRLEEIREEDLIEFEGKDSKRIAQITAKDARIKELEEMIRQLGSLAFMGDMPLDQIVAHFIAWGQSNYDYTSRLEAAFLELHEHVHGDPLEAREALERIRNGE